MNFFYWFPHEVQGKASLKEISFFDPGIVLKRQALAKAISTSTDILEKSKVYSESWRLFAKQCENQKHTIRVSRIFNFVWENHHKTTFLQEYRSLHAESRILRFETVLAIMTYVQALINQGITKGDLNSLSEALNQLMICRVEIQNWTQRNESNLPFECTMDGNTFYSLLTGYYIQKSEIVGLFPKLILDHEDYTVQIFNDDELKTITKYGTKCIQILDSMIWFIENNVNNGESKKLFFACVPETIQKQMQREYYLVCSIVYYCYAKRFEDENYNVYHRYLNYCVKNFIRPLESEKDKSRIMKATITLIKSQCDLANHWNSTFNYSSGQEDEQQQQGRITSNGMISYPENFITETREGKQSKSLEGLEFNLALR